ncbi:MAG: hypothetical protein JSV12_08785 [Candidatus Bathyarchaeota archaeon]|nr:MAG: hypothetical protein JSV12_08785 [Candidatus Bathyarchaeota archaeon]
MVGKGIIIGSIIVLALLSAGTFLLLNSLVPLEKKDILLSDSFNVAGNTYENRTAWIGSSGEYVASFTVSEGTIKGCLLIPPEFSNWLEGISEPDWIESNQADFEMTMDLGEGEGHHMYFVFVNDDSFTKEVYVEFSKVWEETNYVNLFGGATLVLLGTIITILLKYK